ncbi:MAG: UDP-3-O-(3-hydroxymyristoyl)glucosamine N-acyltransferase [Planctomycetota bacterium]
MKEKTLAELAEYVGGKVKGNPNIKIRSTATLEQAGEGDISFLNNPKYVNQLKTTKASAVVVNKDIETSTSLLVIDDPYFAFREIVVLLYGHRPHKKTGVSKKASISESAVIGKECDIADFVTISDKAKIADRCVIYPSVYIGPETEIGSDCTIYPNVVIYDRCKIGNRVTIHANATIGEDGFGFATYKAEHHKIPHIGSVIIEDDVEIGSGCGIERGTLDNTVIGKGTKIGDLVAIGHGTKVGPHCLLVAQVGIAGSSRIGRHCVAGGQAGIVGHINIGNEVMIAAQAGVINDIPDGKTIIGAPAIDASKARRAYALIESLPQMRQSIKKLEKQLKKLEKE